MDPRFNEIFTEPENQIFKVVFFPDRIYHAEYLNATRSDRYRYNVKEVRSKLDAMVLKGEVYMDGQYLCNFIRIEYRASRLVEQARIKNRLLGSEVRAWIKLLPSDPRNTAEAIVKLHHCPWIGCYQTEIWETLEPPPRSKHDFTVLDQMGLNGAITRVKAFGPALRDLDSLDRINIAFSENDLDLPSGRAITDPQWDNNFLSSHEEPRTQEPSSFQNTVKDMNYELNFQRAWYLDARKTDPVRYRSGMMDPDNPDAKADNIIEMRWLIQRQLGSSIVFFHEVTIPPHTVEGTHQHIGSEELYYVIQGKGFAYVGADDCTDPEVAKLPTVQREIYGLGYHDCKKLPVEPGKMLFIKSGGIHGIENPFDEPLRFVAFLYQSA